MSDPIQTPTLPPVADLDQLGDQIAELSAHIQAATYRLLVLIREFDARGGWNGGLGEHGFRSCAHWLNWRTGLDLGAAREKFRVARALEDLPRISAAMQKGEISYSKVRALTRVATPENEEELLEFALTGTAAHVEKLVRAWRRVDRLEAMEDGDGQHEHRYLRAYTDEDGMVVVRARLAPEVGAIFLKALEAAAEELYQRSRECEGMDLSDIPPEQRRADALELLAESALEGGLDPGTAGDRYQVVVHVEGGVLEDGENVPAGTSWRLGCDSSRHFGWLFLGPATLCLPMRDCALHIRPNLRSAMGVLSHLYYNGAHDHAVGPITRPPRRAPGSTREGHPSIQELVHRGGSRDLPGGARRPGGRPRQIPRSSGGMGRP